MQDDAWTFATPQYSNISGNVFFGQNGNTLFAELRAAVRCKISDNVFAIGGGGCLNILGGSVIDITDNFFYDFQRATQTNIINTTAENVYFYGNHITNNLSHTHASLVYFDNHDYISVIGNRVDSIGSGNTFGACFYFADGANKVCAANDCRNSGAQDVARAPLNAASIITDISGNLI